MTVTVRIHTALAIAAVLGVLVGMAVSQVSGAVGSNDSQASASAGSSYAVYRQLQSINAKLGSQAGGSIAPVLQNVEQYVYAACAAAQGHRSGTCSLTGY